ncbi:UNVERIFIED_CONTAM: ToMV resistance protein Tm-2(2) [Sesamum radiatum]|uniref:ToMV resistance protein Tm-2(2) n=1 Tax=Sesamum radiatum TaxID=300843 RepID=A0AAW2THI4_SESRA
MAAEAATISVINKAVEVGGNLIIKTGNRIYHLQENISWIEREMRTLQSYLKDAESKRSMSHEVANLIINIRDLAQDVEDILDTYLPKIESHNTEDLQDRRKLFLLAPRDSKIVGREGILCKLEQEMLSENKGSRIISVVGPAGVGKTTVAKRVYQMTKNEFDVYAIVYVSQEPRLGELLLDIAKQVGLLREEKKEEREEEKKEELANMEDKLHLFLRKKRYAILLDDVWNTKTWDLLSSILPTNSENGSRIIVTSRYIDVGRYIGGESSLIQLNLLGEEEGKALFFDLISETFEEALPPVLRDISEKIVERCDGSPLAIEVAVGLLRARGRSKIAWNQVLESMISPGAENNCMEILALSYQDLPTELKPLFLYFGMFPEDREIFIHELTKIWVVEKLIKVEGSRKPESIVEANIDKLISRNLLQVSRMRSDGRIRSTLIIEVEGKEVHLPKEIANLSGLSYLRLKGYLSSGIPSCIRNMKNLLSLENLKGVEVALPNLETLHFDHVFGCYITPSSFKSSNLRKLRLANVHRETLETLSNATPSLQNLEDLKLGPEFPEGKLSSPPRVDLSRYHYLVKLYLKQFRSSWQIQLPPNLVQITLERIPNIGDSVKLLK